ncbi:hypothetical protein D9M72_560950 [compost metagenome]
MLAEVFFGLSQFGVQRLLNPMLLIDVVLRLLQLGFRYLVRILRTIERPLEVDSFRETRFVSRREYGDPLLVGLVQTAKLPQH